MNFKNLYQNLGVLVLAASMTAGCMPKDELAEAQAKEEHQVRIEARHERAETRRAERDSLDYVTIMAQITGKEEHKNYFYLGLSSINLKLNTEYGPKILTVLDKSHDTFDTMTSLKTIDLLDTGDIIQVTYERINRKNELKKVDEQTGHLEVRPSQIKLMNNIYQQFSEPEDSLPRYITMMAQINEKMNAEESVSLRLSTGYGPKLVTILANTKLFSRYRDSQGLTALKDMLNEGDFIQITYKRVDDRDLLQRINEETGYLELQPSQIRVQSSDNHLVQGNIEGP